MKNFILIAAAIALLLASCKKDHQNVPAVSSTGAKMYPVSFAVSQFEQTTGNIYKQATASVPNRNLAASFLDTTAFGKAIFEYYFLVYDNTGREVSRIQRNALHPEFINIDKAVGTGTAHAQHSRADSDPYNVITDSLAAGTYTVVVTGYTFSHNQININNKDGDEARDHPTYLPLATANIFTDQGLDVLPRSIEIYFGKSVVTISGPTSAAPLTLNRIVGQAEVDLTDAVIPSNVSFIILGRPGELNAYLIGSEMPNFPIAAAVDPPALYDTDYTLLTTADYTSGHYKMQRFVLNTISPMDIVITAYDKNNVVLASKTVPQVKFEKNRRTVLTGKLFDNSVPSKFTITANTAWGPDTPPITFKKHN